MFLGDNRPPSLPRSLPPSLPSSQLAARLGSPPLPLSTGRVHHRGQQPLRHGTQEKGWEGGREGGREGEREYISLRFTSFCPSSLFSQMLEAAKDPERKPVVLLGDAGMRRVDTAGALSHFLPPPLPPFLLSVAPVLLPHLCHASNHILIDRPHCSPSLLPSLQSSSTPSRHPTSCQPSACRPRRSPASPRGSSGEKVREGGRKRRKRRLMDISLFTTSDHSF